MSDVLVFSWNVARSVGHPDLDADHRRILSLGNRAIGLAGWPDDAAHIGELLDDMIDCATAHFARETPALRALGFPVPDEHQRHHGEIANQARLLKSRFLAREEISREVARFATSWIVLHELSEIRDVRRFLLARGLL